MSETPPPLRDKSLALLAGYRTQRAMPADARARVLERLAEAGAAGSSPSGAPSSAAESSGAVRSGPPWKWIALGGALAAAVVAALVVRGDRASQRARLDPPNEAQLEAPRAEEDGVATPRPAPRSADGNDPAAAAPSLEPVPPPPSVPPADASEAAAPPAKPPSTSPSARHPRPRPSQRSPSPTNPPTTPPTEPRSTPAEPPRSTLGEENALISSAWRHVTAKDLAQATVVIDTHAKRFPRGVLVPERRALSVIVRCLRGPEDAALVEGFATRYPRSPLLKKVREACRPPAHSPSTEDEPSSAEPSSTTAQKDSVEK